MGIELRQTQKMKLNMTQSLYQAISLLQYNTQELSDYLYQQSLENPLIQLENCLSEPIQIRNNLGTKKSATDVIEELTACAQDFREGLVQQTRFLDLDDNIKTTVFYLIDNLDDRGYLAFPFEEIIKDSDLKNEIAYKSLKVLQSMEPYGIGAQNLEECLLLQLVHRKPRSPLAEKIVRDHLHLISEGEAKLAKYLGVHQDQVKIAIQAIQSCEPYPASVPEEPVQYIVPDASVIEKEGQFKVSIEDQWLPKLTVNKSYYQTFKEGETRDYISQKFKEAQWLHYSLTQRHETLLSVTETIVKLQEPFLRQGLSYLQPLTLKNVAELLNIHESTVSRTIKNKFLQTSFGVLSYKKLFVTGLPKCSGEAVSTEWIKARIRKIIDEENRHNPITDQRIVDILHEEDGILISRRAVAKYRLASGFPSSTKRKIKG